MVADPRARRALAEAVHAVGAVVRDIDLVAAAIRAADAPVLEVLARALRAGTAADLHSALPAPGPDGSRRSRGRDGFAPNALRAIDEFGAVLRGSAGVLDGVALELLLHFALTHLSADERATIAVLDVPAAG